MIGSNVGRFRVLSLLGRGGMGEIYVGYDETLDRRVALKSIRADRRLNERARARFLREARLLSQLDHSGICRIYDYVEQDEQDFLVLELIEGRSLEAAIAEGLTHHEQLRIAESVADALVAAHAESIVHRDLKPANVMLTKAGEVKVLDFGLAQAARPAPPVSRRPPAPREALAPDAAALASAGETPAPEDEKLDEGGESLLTQHGAVLGTPAFMSPEQARGENATTASDMYSFGLLLQNLFTGRLPYPEDISVQALMERALRAETLPLTGAPRDVASLVERLKSNAPAARPTAVETAARLRFIRDAPRRRLRRLAAAAALALAALGALKYTLDLRRERAVAVVAREEAERRREQAEDLVQFMLGDLRQRLEPVGRLDALDGAADKALAYFASLGEHELTDSDRFRRAKALTQIGEVRIAQNDLDAARRSLDEAHARAREIVAREPRNGEWLMGLGAIEFWIGNVDWLRGDLAAAQRRFEAYLGIAERLVALDARKPDWRLELAYAHSNLGTLEEARGNAQGALEHFRLTVEAKRALHEAEPDSPRWRKELADSLSWFAEALFANGEVASAHVQYEAGRLLLAELVAAEPKNTSYRFLLGIAHSKVAVALEALGRGGDALAHYEQYLTIGQALATLDPANADWAREVAMARQLLGVAVARREPAAGLRHLRLATETLERLQLADPSNVERQIDLARSGRNLARGLLAGGAPAEAVPALREAIRHLPARRAADDRRAPTLEGDLRTLLGEACLATGASGDAREAFELAVAALLPLSGSRDPNVIAPLAQALLRLGRVEEARPLVARLGESRYSRWDLPLASRAAVRNASSSTGG